MNIAEDLEQGRRDGLYVEANRETFLSQYAERWIAVLDEQLITTNADLHDLLDEIDTRGVPRDKVYIEYLTTDDTALVLHLG